MRGEGREGREVRCVVELDESENERIMSTTHNSGAMVVTHLKLLHFVGISVAISHVGSSSLPSTSFNFFAFSTFTTFLFFYF